VKINQYCSVCKKHLDMEVIPTDDGGDDGVIWLRCPECQGFLPKFSGEGLAPADGKSADHDGAKDEPAGATSPEAETETPAEVPSEPDAGRSGVADVSPSDTEPPLPVDVTDVVAADLEPDLEPDAAPAVEEDATAGDESEPVAEYAAALAAADPETARPYRPGSRYEIGDVVHHLAYDDFGVVVAKEDLPGGRTVAKVYFEKVGVVRLIEQAADGRR
jgi:hypothetical protein